ncbi:MAG: glutamine--fructose-6-phosphate transaminase (isomerizing) [Bacillota bacterium]
MCGIVGYIGRKDAVPFLVNGLKKLEYRGYDSAGIVVQAGDKLNLRKSVGRLSRLEEILQLKPVSGVTGIGHTRWATHGKPSDRNAHPHMDCLQKIAVAHNGIIENYLHLREWLQEQGHVFASETDTEVIPHLIEQYYRGDLVAAVKEALTKLEGSFAMVAMSQDHPGLLAAARKDSPLIVGFGNGENYIASDIPAVLSETKDVVVLNDREMAVVTAEKVEVSTFDGGKVDRPRMVIDWDPIMAEKTGYEDFMLKEIHEEPRALRDTMTGKIDWERGRIVLPEIKMAREDMLKIKKIFIVACGTAYHAGLVGKCVLEKLLRIPVEVDLASEFRYRNPMIDESMLTIIISQSGETADTLAALRESKQRGSRILAITNVRGSSVYREADDVFLTLAGPEIAVASTKAYSTQLLSLYMIAFYLAQEMGTCPEQELLTLAAGLQKIPEQVEKVLGTESKVKEFAESFKNCEDIFFLGRGIDYAVSLEGALKLKEISYIHAEAYAAGELKHGTLALIVKDVPVFALATQPALYEKMISNVKEVKAREATVVALALAGDLETGKSVDYVLHIPATENLLTPILSVVPLQLFAYYAAKARGCDVDKPRNLAKSVTVE